MTTPTLIVLTLIMVVLYCLGVLMEYRDRMGIAFVAYILALIIDVLVLVSAISKTQIN